MAQAVETVAKRGTGEARMLAACNHQEPDATPVWFMRQAGRCLQDYRALREKYDILTLAKTPELSAEVTLMPVKQLGVDAAVMFADIMIPLEGMGFDLELSPIPAHAGQRGRAFTTRCARWRTWKSCVSSTPSMCNLCWMRSVSYGGNFPASRR